MDRGSGTPFWKIAAGVMMGVLLADLVRMAWMALAMGAAFGSWGVTFDKPGKITEVRPPAAAQRPQLPAYDGLITANQRGTNRACINGTVVDRTGNGWSQALVNDRPQPCREKSP